MKFHKILTVEEQVRKLRKKQEKIFDRRLNGERNISVEDLARDMVKGQEFIEAYSEIVQIYAACALHLEPKAHAAMSVSISEFSDIWNRFCVERKRWAENQAVLESRDYLGPPKSGKRVDTHA